MVWRSPVPFFRHARFDCPPTASRPARAAPPADRPLARRAHPSSRPRGAPWRPAPRALRRARRPPPLPLMPQAPRRRARHPRRRTAPRACCCLSSTASATCPSPRSATARRCRWRTRPTSTPSRVRRAARGGGGRGGGGRASRPGSRDEGRRRAWRGRSGAIPSRPACVRHPRALRAAAAAVRAHPPHTLPPNPLPPSRGPQRPHGLGRAGPGVRQRHLPHEHPGLRPAPVRGGAALAAGAAVSARSIKVGNLAALPGGALRPTLAGAVGQRRVQAVSSRLPPPRAAPPSQKNRRPAGTTAAAARLNPWARGCRWRRATSRSNQTSRRSTPPRASSRSAARTASLSTSGRRCAPRSTVRVSVCGWRVRGLHVRP
jgi:hypothetical protein